jgi:hypothetical protein
MTSITIDGTEYNLDNASDSVKSQLANLQYVNELIVQKNNELQVAQTAQMGYSLALQRELGKIPEND